MLDSQCKAVYDWEGEWVLWNVPVFDLKTTKFLVNAACSLYGVPTPPVKVLNKKKKQEYTSYYDPSDHSIAFARPHLNRAIALHESAHAIHSYLLGHASHETHGPEWLAIYLNLLVEFGVAPLSALKAGLYQRQVKYRALKFLSPEGIKYHYRGLIRKAELERDDR